MNLNKRTGLYLVAGIFTLVLSLTACFVEHDPDPGVASAVWGTATGTESETTTGYDGTITVTVTAANGIITAVDLTGTDLTDVQGQSVKAALPGRITAANSFDVDVVSNATITSNAVKTAGKTALSKIDGYAEPSGE